MSGPRIAGLGHVTLRTARPQATRRFYAEVFGLVPAPERPAFPFPGFWLRLPGGPALVHVLILDAREAEARTGAIDHVAFDAEGFAAYRARLEAAGVGYREQVAPGGGFAQLFFYDPNGVLLELTFECAAEGGAPSIDPSRALAPGARWFDAEAARALWGET